MENKAKENHVNTTFMWRIDDFSKLNKNWHYSDSFLVGDYKFRILICSKRGNQELEHKDFTMYLVADVSVLLNSTNAQFSLTVVNQLENDKSITMVDEREFKKTTRLWGFTFMRLTDFHDSSAGYVVNGVCIIEAKVTLYIHEVENSGSIKEELESSNSVDSAKKDKVASPAPEPPGENHVSSASFVNKVLDKARRVKKLREDVVVLENEMKRRKTMLAAVELDLDVAKADLAKAEQDFVGVGMDVELGA